MPNFTFTGPQGQQITVTGPEGSTPEQAFAIAQQHLGQTNNPAQTKVPGYQASDTGQFTPSQAPSPIKDAITNVAADTIRHQGIPLDTISQGVNAVTDIPRQLLSHKVDQFNKIQSEATRMMGKPQGDYGAQSNAIMQAGADVLGNLLPMAVTPEAEAPKAAGLLAKEAPSAFQTARELNISIPPSYAQLKGGQTTISPMVEGLVGAPKAAVEASVKNAPAINQAVAKDLPSFEKGAEFTDENLDEAAKPYYDKYTKTKALGKSIPIDSQFKDGVASIGQESSDAFPMDSSPALEKLKQAYLQPDSFGSNGAVLKIRQLRSDAGLNISSRDPERMQLGYAQRKIATLIEDQMDRFASSRPEGFDNPNLISDFRDARTQIAKIETARDARLPGTTDISPARLFRMKNNSNVPLSGNMDKIADLYGNFKPALQDAAPLRNKTAYNRFEGAIGAGGAVLSVAKDSPGIFLKTMGLLATPPLARKALLSAPFQNSMLPKALSPLDLLLRGQTNRLMTGGATNLLQNPLLGNQ